MKTSYPLILFSLVCCINLSHAQDMDRAMKADPVVWFGFDFTRAKFVYVSESARQLKDVLTPINQLVPVESKKYHLSRYFEKQTVHHVLEPVLKRNEAIDPSVLTAVDPVTLTGDDVQETVSAYAGASDKAETGLIFVVENCDKSTQQISVYVCFFEMQTGKIFHMVKSQGKAGGFGLRNYWAGGLYRIMKNWKYRDRSI